MHGPWTLLAAAGLLCAAPHREQDEAARAVEEVSLEEVRELVAAVGVEELFERVAHPSPYLTDFFGIQALQDVPAQRVLADLVPEHAALVSRDPHALVLELKGGPRVAFRYGVELRVVGNPVGVPYARVMLDEPAAYPSQAEAFRAALERAGLAERYLVHNPYHELEEEVAERLAEPELFAEVDLLPDRAAFEAAPHAVAVVGETHGTSDAYDRARALLESPAIEWIGIEMIGEDLQPLLDRFLDAPAESPERAASRAQLVEYYRGSWNTRGHEVTADPADNPYFRLIERAAGLGKRVVALDVDGRYNLFRFGEFPLGKAVRDAVWARNVPEEGRGVLYGGGSHLEPRQRPSALSFLRERFPELGIILAGE